MPVFYYDHNGNLRVIPDAERDRRSGSGHKTVLHGRVHKGRVVEPRKPNPSPSPDPEPRQPAPHPKPAPDPGGEKPPKPKEDSNKAIIDAAIRLLSAWVRQPQTHASYSSPPNPHHTRAHIPMPKPVQSPPVNLPKAEYNHLTEGKIDLWHKLEKGHVLEPREARQLFHAIDLQKYGAKTDQAKQQAETARQYAEDKLARNMVANAPKDKADNILLQGTPIPVQATHAVAEANVQHFQQHDRYMNPLEIVDKIQELIRESGKGYYQKSNNIPMGSNSMNNPVPIEKVGPIPSSTPNLLNYGYSAFFGQGQDVVVDINRIEFSREAFKLTNAFWEKDNFKVAYQKLLKTGMPQKVTIDTVEIPTVNPFTSAATLGKIKVEVYGLLYSDRNRQPVFSGTIQQGHNAEVWTFPQGAKNRAGKQKRNPVAEASTTVGRNSPVFQFRTIIQGKRGISFPVILKQR